ncbi:MAG: hypothetical protein WCT16_03735 [Candidatus Buchananbacteria bacterium]
MLLHQLKSEADGKSATMGIRWCLSPEQIERLKAEEKEAKILITVLHIKQRGIKDYYYEEESRKVLPITEGSTFISFRNPGRHIICAGIIDVVSYSPESYLKIQRRYAGFNDYNYPIINTTTAFMGKGTAEGIGMYDHRLLTPEDFALLEVDVDEKSFAPEPRDYRLVNYWFDTKPIDQCHHRKRRFLAYFLTITLLPIMQILKVWAFAIGNVFVGVTLINWRSIFKPLTYGAFCDIYYSKILNYIGKNGEIKTKKWWKVLLNWRFIIGYACLLPFIATLIATNWLLLFATLCCLGFVSGSAAVIGRLIDKYQSKPRFDRIQRKIEKRIKKEKLLEQKQNEEEELRKQKQARELERMACSLLPEEISYATLPKKPVRLRFQHLKSKVCRPFAGN